MEFIKITYPKKDLMDNSLNEQQCDELFDKVVKLNESSPEEQRKMVREAAEDWIGVGITGTATIAIAIYSLIKWTRNKYKLTVEKLYDHSKELNDIYVKVNDLLSNDKMVRFKHRNDVMDADVEYIVMRDTKDPRKTYQLVVDYLAYDPEYFINEINEIVKYVDKESKNKDVDFKNMTESLIREIDDGFMQDHGFITYCEPVMKVEHYKGMKLEKVLMEYKEWVGNIYNILYLYNKYVASELDYLQLLQTAYQKMLRDYGNSKENKALVDSVFTKLIKNITMSMDFNAKAVTIFNDMIKFYAEELKKIYEDLKK